MIRTNQCPKCGNTRIAGPHNVFGGEGHVKIDLPGLYTATLVAFTCVDCGYTEFYSDRYGLENLRRDGRFRVSQEEVRPTHCSRCGARLSPADSICYECGAQIQ